MKDNERLGAGHQAQRIWGIDFPFAENRLRKAQDIVEAAMGADSATTEKGYQLAWP